MASDVGDDMMIKCITNKLLSVFYDLKRYDLR